MMGVGWKNALARGCLARLTWRQCALATGVFPAPVAAEMAATDSWQPPIYQAQYVMLIDTSSFYFGSTGYIMYSK